MLITKAKAMANVAETAVIAALATGEGRTESVLQRHLRAERPTNDSPAQTSARPQRQKGQTERMSTAAALLDRKIDIVRIGKKLPHR
jgi:hypothetical protein